MSDLVVWVVTPTPTLILPIFSFSLLVVRKHQLRPIPLLELPYSGVNNAISPEERLYVPLGAGSWLLPHLQYTVPVNWNNFPLNMSVGFDSAYQPEQLPTIRHIGTH